MVLPQSGDKMVAGEAFQNLDENQKQIFADKVNRKTKKVHCSYFFLNLMTYCGLFIFKVTRESLKDLLTSEIVAVNEMQHGEPSSDKSADEEGILELFGVYRVCQIIFFATLLS